MNETQTAEDDLMPPSNDKTMTTSKAVLDATCALALRSAEPSSLVFVGRLARPGGSRTARLGVPNAVQVTAI
jgi:hypothetical protein